MLALLDHPCLDL